MACNSPIAVQTLFLGATVQQYDASIGWGGSNGSLSVTVVEDICITNSRVGYNNGGTPYITADADMFNPPKLGSPVYFQFGTFFYYGILQSWKEQKSKSGKLYDVRIVDPASILSGTQIIINSYTGQTFNIPNLINAFALIEDMYGNNAPVDSSLLALLDYVPSQKFGGARVNNAGISWNQLKEAISLIINTGLTRYGNLLNFRGNRFYVDLSELPYLDDSFRLSGDSLSLLDIINTVCEYAGCDFFIDLYHTDIGNFIKPRLVSRYKQPASALSIDNTQGSAVDDRLNLGKISSFISSVGNSTQYDRGLELRDETTNCFLVGDYRSDMWQITYSYVNGDGWNETIWPYWGIDNNGYPIRGSGYNDDHTLTLDATTWNIPELSGGIYTVKLNEIRAAAQDFSTWEEYAKTNHPELISSLQLCSEVTSTWSNDEDFKQKAFINGVLKPLDIVATDKTNVENMSKMDKQVHIMQLFNRISTLGNTYLARKFMVGLPFIASATDQNEPYSIKLNFKPTDSAWSNIPILNIPIDSIPLEQFRDDSGKIKGFVHFYFDPTLPEMVNRILDLSQLPAQSYIRISDTEAYVLCTVEEIVFLNPIAKTYPRAVISLPGIVQISKPDDSFVYSNLYEINTAMVSADKQKENLRIPNMQNTMFANTIYPLLPDGAAVPLQSTTLSYGPWYATLNGSMFMAPAGQTKYERNTDLNPWNYGSELMMNIAGKTLVNTAVTQQQVLELGSVTVAGGPSISRLGDILTIGGPEVTNITCSVGINGVTTTYSLKTCTPSFGIYGKTQADTMKFNGKWNNKFQRLFLQQSLAKLENNITAPNNFMAAMLRPDRYNKQSAGTFLIGQNIADPVDSGNYRNTMGLTDLRKCLPELMAHSGEAWQQRAGMELGGLLRPYSTKYQYEYDNTRTLSQFKSVQDCTRNVTGMILPTRYDYTVFKSYDTLPPVSGEGNCPITVNTLNPFLNSGTTFTGWNLGLSKGHDIEYVVRDGIYPTDLCVRHPGDNYSEDNWYRAIALKGPLVIAGWGYDIYGKPVPNSGSNTAYFKENWLRRPQDWKCGPVDLRWDDRRGVWTAPPSNNLIQIKTIGVDSLWIECEVLDAVSSSNNYNDINYNNRYYKYTDNGTKIDNPIIFARRGNLSVVSGIYGLAQYDDRVNSYDINNVGIPNFMKYKLLYAEAATFTVEADTSTVTKNDIYWTTQSGIIRSVHGMYAGIQLNIGKVMPCQNVPPISGYIVPATLGIVNGVETLIATPPFVMVNEPGKIVESGILLLRTNETISTNNDDVFWGWTYRSIPKETNCCLTYGYSTSAWSVIGSQCYESPVCGSA